MPASIEYLHELVGRLQAAVVANRQTKGRTGSLVRLSAQDADFVVVTGDLHGNRLNFNRITKAVGLERFPKRHLVVQEVIHGGPTYPPGGCQSHMLLEDLASWKVKYPDRFHVLLSNHELAECIRQPIVKGGISQNQLFGAGLEFAYGLAAGRIHECLCDFIRSCPLALRLENRIFISHTLPDKLMLPHFDWSVFHRDYEPYDLQMGGSAHALVWGRDYDLEHVMDFLNKVEADFMVTGHEPTPEGSKLSNPRQIILDASGAVCWLCPIPADREVTASEIFAKLRKLT